MKMPRPVELGVGDVLRMQEDGICRMLSGYHALAAYLML